MVVADRFQLFPFSVLGHAAVEAKGDQFDHA
jgi:hypothetical protein